MFRTINEQNRSLDVETKIEMAIKTLVFEDFENAIRHVDEYIKETY
jgi:anti-sigma regulatory factor (Ser/Thr protein kinase)